MTTETEAPHIPDVLYDDIDAQARRTYTRHRSSIRGQQVTRADSFDTHLISHAYRAGHAAAKAETAAPVVGRWYFVANDGAATLCVDEADARESAAEADIAFPRMAPHRPAVAVPVERDVMRQVEQRTVAALYVEPAGCYVGALGVDPWDEARDARTYSGPHPVVAHPPCQRWGRFWHGSTRKPHQYKLGDDGGCFEAAFKALKRFGGVLEHPAHSKAFDAFKIMKPRAGAGWQFDREHGVWVCYVEQGHYGHASRKPTWLIACGMQRRELPELNWTKGEQRLPEWMIERYGYEKARRIGVVAMVGGKNKTAIRNATPPAFRDLLLSIARQALNKN